MAAIEVAISGLLLGLAHLRADHAVGRDAVADDLVVPLAELLHQERIALRRHRIDRDAGPDLVAVEYVEDAEDAGAVAVLALRPGAVVGMICPELAREPAVPHDAVGRQQLVIFEMQHDVEGHACVARPVELGPLRIGHVVVPGIVHPGGQRRRVLGNRSAHVRRPFRDAAGRVSARSPCTSRGSPRRCRPRHPCACGYRTARGRDASAGAVRPSCRDAVRCT